MKKQLLKKFSAFIVTAMMFSASANAQIVYTDVNPDVSDTCTSTSVSQPCNKVDSIDLNNDGIFDLKLSLSASIMLTNPATRLGSVKVSPLHGNKIKTDGLGYPLFMNLNDVIDTNGSWTTTADQILISKSYQSGFNFSISGNWITATDSYLGLKIISGSQTNYCWVRLIVAVTVVNSAFATFTLKDYAYNTIPNQSILAGQTTATGISPLSFREGLVVRLYPNPTTNHLTIALGSNNKKVEVTISDITGKIIYKTISTDIQNIEVNTADFPAGIYAVQIQSADFIATQKLVIQK